MIHVTYLYFHSDVFFPLAWTVFSDPLLSCLQTVK